MLVNCSVCLYDINLFDKEVSILNCGHFFHANCLNDWLQQQMNCPECRALVTRSNVVEHIFPKFNQHTVSQLKSLQDKCDNLQNENSLLKLKNSSYKDTVSKLKSLENKCNKLQREVLLLKINNLSLKKVR